jgi:hypothetical protein
MTPQMRILFTGSNGLIFFGWLIFGIIINGEVLLGSVLVLSFFILVLRTNSQLAFIASIVIPVICRLI